MLSHGYDAEQVTSTARTELRVESSQPSPPAEVGQTDPDPDPDPEAASSDLRPPGPTCELRM